MNNSTNDFTHSSNKSSGFSGLGSLATNEEITRSPPPSTQERESVDPALGVGTTPSQSGSASPSKSNAFTDATPTASPRGLTALEKKGVIVCGLLLVAWFLFSSSSDKDAATSKPSGYSRPTLERPPLGSSNHLSGAQLRYCLAEEIRLDGARSTVNDYSSFQIDRFNSMVSDYNDRCGSFRYKRGALESARRDVEAFRSSYFSEGAARF